MDQLEKKLGLETVMCMCVFMYLLLTEYQNPHSTSKVSTFMGKKDNLAGPPIFKDGLRMLLRLGWNWVWVEGLAEMLSLGAG